ncbi:MAG TPA: dihydroxyacetone kinase subunit DhaL [Sumerlaeia bacterium]|nr:dihydroxyacetone kinase subunit DhaL [Sumerlaeia bacterium]
MSATIGCNDFIRMLRAAIAQIEQNHETLSRLDSHGGDGDHGSTMRRAMACVEKAIAETGESPDLKALLHNVGWAVMGVDGGATGPLFGMLFMGMSAPAAGKADLDAAELAGVFEAGLASVRKNTKAQVGDKTLIDALAPAVETLRKEADAGADPTRALEAAAAAAQAGAAATKEMQARFGRAKNVKEKSIGNQDAGAASVSLIFRGFAKGVQSNG